MFDSYLDSVLIFFFFQAEDGIRDIGVTGVQTCALPLMASISIPASGVGAATKTRRRMRTRLPAAFALLPTALVVLVVYVGCMLWTVRLSFTSSTLLPKLDWVGLAQYSRLFANDRFLTSASNIVLFGALFISGCLILGFLLAVFIDQNVRGEGVFRTMFLYPDRKSTRLNSSHANISYA